MTVRKEGQGSVCAIHLKYIRYIQVMTERIHQLNHAVVLVEAATASVTENVAVAIALSHNSTYTSSMPSCEKRHVAGIELAVGIDVSAASVADAENTAGVVA